MTIKYLKDSNLVEIDYLSSEKKVTKRRKFSAEPKFLQFNPSARTEIYRVHFEGEAPEWMAIFARKKSYNFYENDFGFSLVKDINMGLVLELPTIESTIHQLVNRASEHHRAVVEPLIEHLTNVIPNLQVYAEELEKYGFSYLAESIHGKSGAIHINHALDFPGKYYSDPEDPHFIPLEEVQKKWQPIVDMLIQDYVEPVEQSEEIPTIDLESPQEIIKPISTASSKEENTPKKETVVIDIDESVEEEQEKMDDNDVGVEIELAIDETSDTIEISVNEVQEDEIIGIEVEQDETDELVIDLIPDETSDAIEITVNEVQEDEIIGIEVEQDETDELVVDEIPDEASKSAALTSDSSELNEENITLVSIGPARTRRKPRQSKEMVEGQLFLFG